MKKLVKKEIEDIFSLTPMQEGMLFHYLKNPHCDFYCEQLCLGISGDIHKHVFEKAWDAVVDVNEMLRTVFRWEQVKNPTQIILKHCNLEKRYYDFSSGDNKEKQRILSEIREKDKNERFDLQEVPLRVTLIKLTGDKYELIISNHHILYDGWSNAIILKEFLHFYHFFSAGTGKKWVKPEKTRFKEFVRWIRERDEGKEKEFWSDYLRGVERQTQLPIKNSRNRRNNIRFTRSCSCEIAGDVKAKIEELLKQQVITRAAFFYGAWGALMQRYDNSRDVVFGTTVSGRSARIKGIENMVGLFINTIPFRVQAAPNEKTVDLLKRLDTSLHLREPYGHTSLVNIKSYSEILDHGEMFDTIMVIENYPLDIRGLKEFAGFSIDSYQVHETTHYPCTVIIASRDSIEITFAFREDLIAAESMVRLAGHFNRVIEEMVTYPYQLATGINILAETEKKQLLTAFNQRVGEAYETTIEQLFAGQVERTPDNIAAVAPLQMKYRTYRTYMTYISYRQLNEKSAQLACTLIKKGVGTDTIVGIMIERSIDMVTGILGILKAGGAYLPIDPGYPRERIDYMLNDSGAKILLTSHEIAILSSPSHLHLPPAPVTSLAYVIYTSGSTGKPKGVMVEQSSVVNLLWSLHRRYPLEQRDTYLLKTSYLFDVSVTELFGWFLQGGRLAVLDPGGEKDPGKIIDIVEREWITHINFVPSMFHTFLGWLDHENIRQLSWLKYIFLAGEVLQPGTVTRFRQLNTTIVLENIYGPTEAAVYASWYSLSGWSGEGPVPIGKPLSNTTLYILDKWEDLQPIGVPGELCIGGIGLARGYLNSPSLTNKKFLEVQEPFFKKVLGPRRAAGGKIYKTGDLARWLPEGNIEFLGRMDFQVKVRGFRIELGEIEKELSGHPLVKEVVVTAGKDDVNDRFLCAYFTADSPLAAEELRNYSAGNLPGYMIPSYFVQLESIPLTPTGKVDRRALPGPTLAIETTGEEYPVLRDEIEEKLAGLWLEVLGGVRGHISGNTNFFAVGGHSLKAMVLASAIHKAFHIKLPLQQLFKTPRFRDLAGYIKNSLQYTPGPGCGYVPVEPAEEKEYYPLSPAQKRLYFLHRLNPGNIGYNMPYFFPLEPPADVNPKEKLETIFKILTARHESLRTYFQTVDDVPVQRIRRSLHFEVKYHEYKGCVGEEEITGNVVRPFDLSQAPLLRVELIKPGAETFGLFIDMHHIITDGTSQHILRKEFNALDRDPATVLPGLRLQYKDYSEWVNHPGQQERVEQQKTYWLRQFPPGEAFPVLNLPIDYSRPLVRGVEGNWVNFALGPGETNILKTTAQENDVTLFMCLLAVFNVLFSKLSGQEDIILGVPIAARRHVDLGQVMGMLVNTLALRNYPANDQSFSRFLPEVKKRTLEAYENQEYPFEELVDQIEVSRDTGRSPLFDVLLNLLNQLEYRDETRKLTVVEEPPYPHRQGSSRFEMTFTAFELEECLYFELEYSTRLYQPGTIDRFIQYLKNIIRSLPGNMQQRLAQIEILSREEKQEILRISNGTGEICHPGKTIHELFTGQVKQQPDHIALSGQILNFGSEIQLSYKELNKRADQVAYVLKEKGARPDSIVGVMMARSPELIIGITAILKTNAGYLPIDADYPGARKAYMIKDSAVKLLLTNYDIEYQDESTQIFKKNEIEILDLRDKNIFQAGVNNPGNPRHMDNRGNLLYLIYTSGSTGRPRGVLLEHGNLINLIYYQYNYTAIDFSRVLQFTTISFDVSAQEIFSTLLWGGRLSLVSKEILPDIPALFKLVEREQIKTLFLPVSFLKFVINRESFVRMLPASVGHIVTAGEQLVVNEALKGYLKANKVYLHNHYGPSEAHVVTAFTMEPGSDIPGLPTIGRPVLNTIIYILDKGFHLVPVGIPGEIFIGGNQVGRGYSNDPELTFEKFLPDFYRSYKSYIYRTGDLGKWLLDGNIEFLGRLDHQVKIRGFRVELGEIENRLLDYPGVKEVVVCLISDLNESDDKYLCAYIVAGGEFSSPGLREYLCGELPDYMIPSYFVQLDKIPLTSNGKIDRKSLPGPALVTEAGQYTGPRDEIEGKLVEIWSDVLALEKEKISIGANFFELGGHSLKAVIMETKIHKELNIKPGLAQIFKNPTVKGLAAHIKKCAKKKYIDIEAVEERDLYELSYQQKRLWFIRQFDPGSPAYNLTGRIILEHNVDGENIKKTLRQLIKRHESLRTVFSSVNDRPVQVVQKEAAVVIKISDLSSLCGEGKEQKLEEIYAREALTPFNLEEIPLFRAVLVKLAETRYCLIFNMHHIISDGWSMEMLKKEFTLIYESYRTGEELELKPLKTRYKDFARWHNKRTASREIRERAHVFWKKRVKNGVPLLQLPFDFGKKGDERKGAAYTLLLNEEQTIKLGKAARSHNTSLFVLMFSFYILFLHRFSPGEDMACFIINAGRNHESLHPIMGFFVNTVLFKTRVDNKEPFNDFLERVNREILKSFQYQEYPLELVFKELNLKYPEVPLSFNMLNMGDTGRVDNPVPGMGQPGYSFQVSFEAKFDLEPYITEYKNAVEIRWAYKKELFKSATIEYMAAEYVKLLDFFVNDFLKSYNDYEDVVHEKKHTFMR